MSCPFHASPASSQVEEPAATGGCPVQHHGAQLDFSADMSYGDYLHLDAVLTRSTR
jgi:tryptophan 2,3-dioxygenase